MIDIVVIRGLGDNAGDDVVSSLLCTVGAAIERGRVEIDKSSVNREDTLSIPYRAGLRPGAIVHVIDAMMGEAWKAIIDSVAIATEGPATMATITTVRSV